MLDKSIFLVNILEVIIIVLLLFGNEPYVDMLLLNLICI